MDADAAADRYQLEQARHFDRIENEDGHPPTPEERSLRMMERAAASTEQEIAFGPFRLLPTRQLLFEAEKPVRLGSRAFDILVALVERAGELVSKEELVSRAWPATFVGEANLRVHVSALRRSLGDGRGERRYVANIPGRGYRFVAPISLAPPTTDMVSPVAQNPANNLPVHLTRMVGRTDLVGALTGQLPQRRFITLVGPGGIGKTTLGLAVADELLPSYKDGVQFVDLAPLTNARLVPSALAAVLGMPIRSETPLPGLIAFLRDKQMLLVLDSCEHVVDAAAALAAEVLKGAPGVQVLATSREPLRAAGESVRRLAPLETPPVQVGLTAMQALDYSAVQLFVDRAAENLDGFELTDANAAMVGDICRRLDGIPLALELAAGRIHAFGLQGTAALLDDRFRLLMRGGRAGLPRHQTLAATLDWSYESLSAVERTILQRVAVFAGGTTLEAVSAVSADAEIETSQVVEGIAELVTKSLIAADVTDTTVYYRLLETTRTYALAKLEESGQYDSFARHHAEYTRDVFLRAKIEWETQRPTSWLDTYVRQIDNLRAALDWAFSPKGDGALGVTLTAAAVPLWFEMSLLDECRQRTEQALARVQNNVKPSPREGMQLFAALGWTSILTDRAMRPETTAAWRNALKLAERIGDTDYRLRAHWGLWLTHAVLGDHRIALEHAEKFRALAETSTEQTDPLVGDRMIGFSLHLLGDQVGAKQRIDNVLSRYVAPTHRSHITRFHFDQRVMAQTTLSQILWLQGFPDQAARAAQTAVSVALSLDHGPTVCNALAFCGCEIPLLTGDLETAERLVSMLIEQATKHTIPVWVAWGQAFKGVLIIKRGDAATGLNVLNDVLSEFGRTRFFRPLTFLGEVAQALGQVGRVAEGQAMIDEALAMLERNEERWCIAELLRLKGALAQLDGTPNAAVSAEEHLVKALDWARRQQALSFELRTATSLARLWHMQGRAKDAQHLLSDVCGRFTEGFETADMRAAKEVLAVLAQPPALRS
jgi:predicted ATPase/DNA-binding winged helix-turn-helix (wHTH) protein